MNKMLEWIRHNQGQTIALVVILGFSMWIWGCDSQVSSITDPAFKVTRAELQREVSSLVSEYERDIATIQLSISQTQEQAADKTEKLDQLDKVKQTVVNLGLVVAQGGTIDPFGAATTLLAILGIGAIADNRKKDGLIIDIKNGSVSP